MSPRHGCSGTAAFLFAFLLVVMASLGIGPAAAAGPSHWIPASTPLERSLEGPDTFYEGIDLQLVGPGESDLSVLESRGARALDRREGEILYVVLLEDAAKAEFEPPARVLVRAGREVLVATTGDAPLLTPDSEASLWGLRQSVRVSAVPMPVVAVDDPAAPELREANPMVQQMVADLSQSRFVTTWQILDDFETRHTLTPQNTAATQWILDEFLGMGLQAQFHTYQQSGPRNNIIATLPGLVDPSKVVYIIGHMDATSSTPSVCAPGADDNASGTAGVIEAARVMRNYAFEYTIKFACFNGEEQGLLGSAAYVNMIASQGEDVVVAYNMDMIAYRGVDPAPPDMIIYTNNNSVLYGNGLRDAANTYLPGLLEPRVIVEAMNSSDHGSFWARGYKAICAIEDEAWGSDFCPWYHTCNDRIERYPTDYVVHCARANLAAAAVTARPIDATGTFLAFGGVALNDDQIGPSNGNGDGNLNPGETVEMWVTVRNLGQQAATGVTGLLQIGSGGATILQGTASWNNIPAGGSGANTTPFVFSVANGAAHGETLPFTLRMTDQTGSRDLDVPLVVVAPSLAFRSHFLDDAAHGNSNGLPEPGEVVVLPVTLGNSGGQAATGVEVTLSSANPNLIPIDAKSSASEIAPGGQAVLNPPFRIALSQSAAMGELVPIQLSIRAGAYTATSSFSLQVGSFLYDDLEAPTAWRLADEDDTATSGRWVRVDPIGTTQSGQPVQPEDDHTPAPGVLCFVTGQGSVGGSAGEADVDGGKTTLTSPIYDLRGVAQPRVTYWRWYTNNLGNNPNQDTWLVQISSNGGTGWVDLERTTASANSWQQRSFLVSNYVTPSDRVVVRFVAADEGGGSLVEAAVDDFIIVGQSAAVSADGSIRPLTLHLDPARPNPTTGRTGISFTLPNDGPARLDLYGVDGRHLRTLARGLLPAGPHRVWWDGTTDQGAQAAPGIYFIRLRAEGEERTERIVLLD